MWRAVLLFVLAIGHGLVLVAQQEALFDHLTMADGLPDNTVSALFQDRDGYIWAGTSDGLARMEGSRIRVFHHDRKDPNSLVHDQVTDITASPSGTMWIATFGGLCRFDRTRGTFTSWQIPGEGVQLTRANRMTDVVCTSDSLVWVVTQDGVNRFDVRTSTFSRVSSGGQGVGPPNAGVSAGALCWDKHRNGLWLATFGGMAFWDAAQDSWIDHRNANSASRLYEPRKVAMPVLDGKGGLWFFDLERLQLLHADPVDDVITVLDSTDTDTLDFTPQCMLSGPENDLWISTWTYKLFKCSATGKFQRINASATEPGRMLRTNVKSMLRTAQGDHWFGTSAGIEVLRGEQQGMEIVRVDSEGSPITEILPWSKDTTIIGTRDRGLVILDHHTLQQKALSWPAADPSRWHLRITALERYGPHRVLVGAGSGPQILDMRGPRVQPALELNEPDLFQPQVNISFLHAARTGAIWAGTWTRGLYRIVPSQGTARHFDTLATNGSLPDIGVLCWLTTLDGTQWIGMNDGGGLARVFDDRIEPFQLAGPKRHSGVIRCLAEDPQGDLWVGTHEEGIEVIDLKRNTVNYITRQDGLPGDRILRITFDRKGGVWAITSNGPAYRPAGSQGFNAVALPSGLHRRKVSGALALLPDGRIAFGVEDYMVFMDPAFLASHTPAPRAVITTAWINDSLLFSPSSDRGITLAHNSKALSLELGALDLAPRQQAFYRYRVVDMDSAWAYNGLSDRINLFELPAGAHRIEAQASSNGVIWSLTPATFNVVVLPAFWATWWFRTLVVLACAAFSILFIRLYVLKRLREQRTAFEREQAVLQERVRIAGDMHDDLGAGLSALKLRSEMALRVEKDPMKREQLGSLANTAGELIGSMRQIIWAMNADQTSVEDLVVYTANYARTYCEQNALAIAVQAHGPWPEVSLNSEQRRNIFLVVKEALHNIVKHAHATSVELHLSCSDQFHVTLSDNGVGLPNGSDDAVGNGLRNMRKRITSLGGTLNMSGENGTRIHFHIPIHERP